MAARLGSRDLDAILTMVLAVNAVEELDGFGPTVTRELHRLVRSDWVSYNEVDPRVPRAIYSMDPVLSPDDSIARRWAELAHQHPVVAHIARTGDGSARRISDLVPRAAFTALDLYRDVFAHLGVEYQVAVGLPAPAPLVLGIAASRRDRDFSTRDVRVMNILRPHLVQAYWSADARTRLRTSLSALEGALGAAGWGVAMIRADGTPEALTAEAGGWLATYTDPEDLVGWIRAERQRLTTTDPHARLATLPQARSFQVGERRLVLRVVTSVGQTDLLLLDERAVEDTSVSLRSLGLSTREADVLLGLTRGLTNEALARTLQVSPSTVKRHLERIYVKLGVQNRTEAAGRAFECLATTPPASRAVEPTHAPSGRSTRAG